MPNRDGHAPAPRALIELTKARLREFFREKGVLFWVFAFPLLMAIGLGLAFRAKPADLPRVALVANEESPLVRALSNSPRLMVTRTVESAARRDLVRSKLDVIAIVEGGQVSYVYDPQQERGALARSVVDDELQRAAGRVDPLPSRDAPITEIGSRYIDYLMPGLIAMNIMGTSMWGVGYNLVLARKRRLLRRFAVTPMHRAQFLMSYFLARSLFLLLEVGALLLFGRLAFGTPVVGSLAAVGAVAMLGAASFAGISLLVGARVDNTETANGWMNLVQLPMWVLSGTFFSYERFPEWLHWPIRCLPLTALSDSFRAIANQGTSLWSLGFELLVLATWGCAGFVIALRHFRWQ
jgi:ABC-2 type transport system permease protein